MEKETSIAIIKSLQTSIIKTIQDKDKTWETGSYKTPVQKAKVYIDGLEDDMVADKKHHGGIDKAVFANSLLNYPKWQKFLKKETPLPFGALAENLTIDLIDENDVFIGDVHKIGDVILEVSQPREPCWKISQKWDNKDFTKYIYESGETGWYYRVVQPGKIKQNDTVELVQRVNDKVSIKKASEILREPSRYPELCDYLLNLEVLSQAWKKSLEKRVERA